MLENPEHLRHFRSNYLNLIILPTEACNFRCTYCYETFENKKMSPMVASGIKALISARGKELDELEIGWFGGEPLLAIDVVTDICKHAIEVSKSEGFAFNSGMTTNGYFLDRKRFRACIDHNVSFFQISLDGESPDHNSSRKLASGAGTFDQIWSNLLEMKQTTADFVVQLRLHYTCRTSWQSDNLGGAYTTPSARTNVSRFILGTFLALGAQMMPISPCSPIRIKRT